MSTDYDKVVRIRPLDDKADYHLWRLRVKAAISAKGLKNVFGSFSKSTTTVETTVGSSSCIDNDGLQSATDDQLEQASNIIISALGDHALRVVRSVIGKPDEMMKKLDDRYDSKSTANRISKMVELISIKYTSTRDDISQHIDRLAGLLEQLQSMDTKLDETLSIGILVSSIKVPELSPVTAAIKTLAEKDLQWENVSSRLIEETNSLKYGPVKDRAAAASANTSCGICSKSGHATKDCFFNPLNPNNKLQQTEDGNFKIGNFRNKNKNISQNKYKSKFNKSSEQKDKDNKNQGNERAAMANHRQSGTNPDRMLLDSGTTSHMTDRSDRVQSQKQYETPITLADDSTVQSKSKGTRVVRWQSETGSMKVSLSETLVAPNIATSLLSIPALANKNIATLFLPGKALMFDMDNDFKILGQASQDRDGLYYIDDYQNQNIQPLSSLDSKGVAAMKAYVNLNQRNINSNINNSITSEKVMNKVQKSTNFKEKLKLGSNNYGGENPPVENEEYVSHFTEEEKLWHKRFGHTMPLQTVRKQLNNNQLPHAKCPKVDCESCMKGKYRRQFKGSITNSKSIGRLHCDTKGKVKCISNDGHKYFLTVLEEFSRYVYACPMRSKSEASEILLRFVKRFEKQSGFTIKAVHADNGTEFSRAFSALEEEGVEVTTSTVDTPESNGLAERTHQTIMRDVRSSLIQAQLPEGFWNYALRHVVTARNAAPHSVTKSAPYFVVFGSIAPYVKHLRPFGCTVTYRPKSDQLTTFGPQLRDGLNLLHENGGIYRILTDDGIIRTKHVSHLEYKFPGLSIFKTDRYTSSIENGYDENTFIPIPTIQSRSTDNSSNINNTSQEHLQENLQPNDADSMRTSELREMVTHYPGVNRSHDQSDNEVPEDGGEDEDVDFDENKDSYEQNIDSTESEINQEEESPRYNLRPVKDVQYSAAAIPEAITTSDEPSIKEALRSPEKKNWLEGIHKEFETLLKNKTWKNEAPPPHVRILPAKIILKLKRNSKGRPARFKGRLVACGNFQPKGVDYLELYAPVACIELVLILISIALALGWEIDQVDVQGAFLNATLPATEEIWIKLPTIEGFIDSGKIVRLLKSLYGLKQAPKLWYQFLAKELQKLGFRRSKVSDCLFILPGSNPVFIVVYVDDLLIIGDKNSVNETKSQLKQLFTVTDLGPCSYFLGISITRRSDGIFLSQKAYIERVIEAAGMKYCKPANSPLPLHHQLYEQRTPLKEEERQEMDNKPYRSILGALLYLSTRTRPDISTATSMLGKFQNEPGLSQWRTLQHLVRYLQGTKDFGIFLPKGDNNQITFEAWSDSDWARDKEKRRSRTGYVLTINGGPIIWSSRSQKATAQSSTEAEFAALQSTVREVRWIQNVLIELGFRDIIPTTIHQDNLGAISWTEETQGLRNVKHVEVKYYYVRHMVDKKRIRVTYTPSAENLADPFTKALVGESFEKLRLRLNIKPIDSLK